MNGYLQVYTGNGKGKSTAAFGLALRARGAGLKVAIIQFIKSMDYSEIKILKQIGVELFQYGRGCFIKGNPVPEDQEIAGEALRKAGDLFEYGETDLVILDEINVAHYFKLFTDDALLRLVESKPQDLELVCTGRYAPDFLIEKADLVTEMKEVKHYYKTGVKARDGIER